MLEGGGRWFWVIRGDFFPRRQRERYELVRAQFNTDVLLDLTILDGGLVVDSRSFNLVIFTQFSSGL